MNESLWYTADGPVTGRGLHALVIGVSRYANQPYGLPDLPASCIAAWTFAQWLVEPNGGYQDLDCPVASVRLLLSPSENDAQRLAENGYTGGAAAANRQNVSRALREWRDACRANGSNRSALYVAGHGFQESTEGALVFMADAETDSYDAVLDIEGVRAGLPPVEQFFFVDACRTIIDGTDLIQALSHPVQGQLRLEKLAGGPSPAAVFFAAASATAAIQYPSGTVFMDALMRSVKFDAVAQADTEDSWAVSASSLDVALRRLVPHRAVEVGAVQSVSSGGSVTVAQLVTRADRPVARVTLDVTPERGREGANVKVYDEVVGVVVIDHEALPVVCSIPAGIWSLSLHYDVAPPPFASNSWVTVPPEPEVLATIKLRATS